jgi:hypothetical protein
VVLEDFWGTGFGLKAEIKGKTAGTGPMDRLKLMVGDGLCW